MKTDRIAFTAALLLGLAGCDTARRPVNLDGGAVGDLRLSPDLATPGACASCPGRCCNNQCADLMNDENNCGACGTACAAGTHCVGGRCLCVAEGGQGVVCAAGRTCCNGTCAALDTDATNCGKCGNDCTAQGTSQEACTGGSCGCGVGGERCGMDQLCCGTQCVDPITDRNHCGSCDTVCAGLATCENGACRNPQGNCGGRNCNANEMCVNNVCVPKGGPVCNPPCAPGEGCVSFQGMNLCLPGGCQVDADCPPGQMCFVVAMLGFGVCM